MVADLSVRKRSGLASYLDAGFFQADKEQRMTQKKMTFIFATSTFGIFL